MGDDFLASLQELFSEAEANQPGHENFLSLREQLIRYVSWCKGKTKAKARAGLDLRFTDNTVPKAFIALPPSNVQLSAPLKDRLRKADSPNEFVGVMRTVFDEQIQRKRKRGRKKKNKQDEEWVDNEEEPEPKGKKPRVLKLKVNGHTFTTAMPKVEKRAPDLEEEKNCDIEDDTMGVDDVKREGSESGEATSELAVSTDDSIQGTPDSAVCSEMNSKAIRQAIEEQLAAETNQQVSDSPNVDTPESTRQPSVSPSVHSDFTPPNEDIRSTPSSEKSTASLTSTDEISKTLDKILEPIQEHIAYIPPETWHIYRAKLVAFLAKIQARASPPSFVERVNSIMGICFLDEEELAVQFGDWVRLQTVVKVCATLAVALGEGDGEMEEAQKWVVKRLRDIEYVKRIVGVKEQIFELESTSTL